MSACPHCGAAMPASFRFCGACGLEMLILETGMAAEAVVWPGTHMGWV